MCLYVKLVKYKLKYNMNVNVILLEGVELHDFMLTCPSMNKVF